MDIATPDQLLEFFHVQLQQAWSSTLGTNVLLRAGEQAVLGSTLSLKVRLPVGVDFQDAVEAFPLACRRTFIVHAHWTPNSHTLMLKAGFELTQNVRRDKGPQSRAHSFDLNEVFSSIRRMQTVRITEDDGLPYHVLEVCYIDELRLQAIFLQYALRMRAEDIDVVLETVRTLKWILFGLVDYRKSSFRELRGVST